MVLAQCSRVAIDVINQGRRVVWTRDLAALGLLHYGASCRDDMDNIDMVSNGDLPKMSSACHD